MFKLKPLQQDEEYSKRNTEVKQIIPTGVTDGLRAQVANALKDLRVALGFSQKELATALGVSQGFVAKWEGKTQMPPGPMCAALSRMCPPRDKEFWLGLAGVLPIDEPELATRSIPLLKEAAALGTPRAIDEREVETYIKLPKEWLPIGGTLFALPVTGDSMSPVLLDGSVVVVDVERRKAKDLEYRMVAARDATGTTIKWLRPSKAGIYSLVPQHTSPEFEVMYLEPHGEFTIAGEVVIWIGKPPRPPAKRRK